MEIHGSALANKVSESTARSNVRICSKQKACKVLLGLRVNCDKSRLHFEIFYQQTILKCRSIAEIK